MKWFLLEEIQRCTWLMTVFPIGGWTDLRRYGVEKTAGYSVIEHERGTERIYFVRERMDASSAYVLQKLLAHPSWAEEINARLFRLNKEFFDFDESLRQKDVSSFSDSQLSSAFAAHAKLQRESHEIGMVWNTLEFDKPLLSNYLLDYLKARVSATGAAVKAPEAFSILTTPLKESFAQQEEKSLLQLAVSLQSDKKVLGLFSSLKPAELEEKLISIPAINLLLEKHVSQFGWLPYMYEGPAWNKKYFIEVLSGLVHQNPDCGMLLEKAMSEKRVLEKRQAELLAQLKVDARHSCLFAIAAEIVFTKGFRKDCIYHGFYCIEPLLKEAAKRLGLSLRQIRRFTPKELTEAIRTGKADADLLNARFNHSVYYTDAVKGESFALAGEPARDFMQKMELEKDAGNPALEATELSGDCACPGHARGIVKLVAQPGHIGKMQAGDILVAHSTNPDIVPAMKKAAAIVTDLGGITCHAAVISRELRIPCVIGTRVATKFLKDGDLVEVDATHGFVRKIQ